MFQEALLESSPFARKRNAWPMATAFTMQLIVASVLVIVPLISSGIISIPARPPLLAPSQYAHAQTAQTQPSGGHGGQTFPTDRPVISVHTSGSIIDTDLNPRPYDNGSSVNPIGSGPGPGLPSNLFDNPQPVHVEPPPVRPNRIIISHSNEAMLLSKVIPEYPTIAKAAGVQGDIKLHAIIGKDGTIQSLTVMAGNSLLIPAALNAVQQWKYRPYMLNGQPVEVETFITVSFKKTN
jgi:periplasmic protein TonB